MLGIREFILGQILACKRYYCVILAFVWPPFKLKANPPKVLQRSIDGIGILGLIILIYLFFTVKDTSAWIYNGGFYLISGMTLFIIASVVPF